MAKASEMIDHLKVVFPKKLFKASSRVAKRVYLEAFHSMDFAACLLSLCQPLPSRDDFAVSVLR